MALYLAQIAYAPEGMASLMQKPHGRSEAVVLEKLGGRIEAAWWSLGEYQVIAVFQVPDAVAVAALGLAFLGGGACKDVKLTPLLSIDEAIEAMKKAGAAGRAGG
ncbi:MAG TPA: GYD domain-containing protein [Polyangia bacterium]|jgi:uncharacterized protein with GYD domain